MANHKKRKLKEMNEAEVKNLLKKEMTSILEDGSPKGNFISIGFDGVSVHSTQVSMKYLVQVADYLVKKHSDFMITKKINKITTGMG